MVLSWIWGGMILISVFCAAVFAKGPALSAAVVQGAQSAVTIAVAMTGAVCLWTGLARVMEECGMTDMLSRLTRPVLGRIFPSTRRDEALARDLSANFCANILGLGNAATPMGIRAARRMNRDGSGTAGDELCRLIVLNTASIQLIPANVAALRSSLGCASPFDILPAVWITSLFSAGLGVTAAWLLGRVWKG